MSNSMTVVPFHSPKIWRSLRIFPYTSKLKERSIYFRTWRTESDNLSLFHDAQLLTFFFQFRSVRSSQLPVAVLLLKPKFLFPFCLRTAARHQFVFPRNFSLTLFLVVAMSLPQPTEKIKKITRHVHQFPSQQAGPYFKCFGTIASLPAGKYDTLSNASRERSQKNLVLITIRAGPRQNGPQLGRRDERPAAGACSQASDSRGWNAAENLHSFLKHWHHSAFCTHR